MLGIVNSKNLWAKKKRLVKSIPCSKPTPRMPKDMAAQTKIPSPVSYFFTGK